MSKQHDRITQRLRKLEMAWAVRSDRFCDANDPLDDQIEGRKTYHIHPNASYPHQLHIVRFDSMREIEEWLKEEVVAREEWEAQESKCTCTKKKVPRFSEDGLIEWCGWCGKLICDHHERKFGTPHP